MAADAKLSERLGLHRLRCAFSRRGVLGTGNHPGKASGASLADGVRGGDGRPQAAVGRERVAAAARHLAQRQPRRLRPVRPLQQALNAHKRAPMVRTARIMANTYFDLEQKHLLTAD